MDEISPEALQMKNTLEESSSQKVRRCANYPFCTDNANECGGWKTHMCEHVQNGTIPIPSREELEEEKRKRRNELKRMRMREARKMN